MLIRRAHVAAVLLAGIILWPSDAARAAAPLAGRAVVLRYHYVAGQSYADQLTVNMQLSLNGSAMRSAAHAGFVTTSGLMRVHILRVDSSGTAEASESITALTETVTINGKTSTQALPDVKAQTVYLGADGSQRGASKGLEALSTPALRMLPVSAVARGAQWTTSAAIDPSILTGLSLAPLSMSVQNTLTGYDTADGQRAAVIDTVAAIEYMSDSRDAGTATHIHLSGRMRGHSLFGMQARRMVSQHAHLDMHLFMGQQSKTGPSLKVDGHVVVDAFVQPRGW